MREGTVTPNKQRFRELREQRGWSQETLAAKAGCGKRTVERIEQGQPTFLATLAELATALGTDVTVGELIQPSDTADQVKPTLPVALTAEPLGHAPPLPSLLVGRDADLSQLCERLCGQSSAAHSHAVQVLTAVRGWPGVGKTTVAKAIAHHPNIAASFPDGVLWTSLGPTPSVLSGLIAWGRAMRDKAMLLAKDVTEVSGRLALLLKERRMLLIVDDVWDASHFVPFNVGGRLCAMLVTTRLSSVAESLSPTPDDVYRLDVLSEDASLELLEKLAPGVVAENRKACRELVKDLEGLPLALQVAGRMLHAEKQRGWDATRLVQELRSDTAQLMNAEAPADMATPGDVSPSVAALLHKSTDCLDATTRKRFSHLAPFAPRPAVFELADIAAVWDVNEAAARETVDILVDRGLLEPLGDGDFQIHQVLVQHAMSLLKKR